LKKISEYYKLFPCMSTRASKIEICNEFHIETAINFVRSIVGNVVDLICGDYTEGSDKCQVLGWYYSIRYVKLKLISETLNYFSIKHYIIFRSSTEKTKDSEKDKVIRNTDDRSYVIFP